MISESDFVLIFVLMALSGALVGALAVGIIWWLT